jgi:phospholipid N-methyltransferase
MGFLAEWGSILRESRRHFQNTGTVMPSSRYLARALTAELHKRRGPARILEAGPGTGAVTGRILNCLLPSDRLDIVEINDRFVELLTGRFEHEWNFWRHREQVRLIHAPLEKLPDGEKYDYIVSGLPLNNFPHDLVRTIYQTYSRLLKPGGTLSYFEYSFVRHLKSPFSSRQERRRLYRVGKIVGKYLSAYEIRQRHVLVNVPPAIVHYLQLHPTNGSSATDETAASPLVVKHL